jgi:pyruvate kinase
VVHLKPKRSSRGTIKEPAAVILDSSGILGRNAARDALGHKHRARLNVDLDWQQRLKTGDIIEFTDLRGKACEMIVDERLSPLEIVALCSKSAYLEQGITLCHISSDKRRRKSAETRLGPVLAPPQITRAPIAGEPSETDESDNTSFPAHISCAPAAVFDYLKPGQRVLIDDGHIAATVESLNEIGALLKITRAKPQGSKLAPEKGLNFPDTKLELPALTDKDRRDLDFIAKHADIVSYSFVQSGADMQLLIDALAERGAKKMGIVAKIETRQALQNLPEIIVRGAGNHPFGVMIARGDLAVEVGYEQLAETQESIMWLCESAHVPVIWATQVLEDLVKEGTPSRGEMTDAAMAARAECVMLNKGPVVGEAVGVLDRLLARMDEHIFKKAPRLRALKSW